MKRVLYSLLLVLSCLLLACSKKKDEIDHGRLAGQAAKHYYEQLLKGKYDAFLNGENRVEKLPDSYRKQLLINFRQFVEQQKEGSSVKWIDISHKLYKKSWYYVSL